jgi:hypothetical protein
MLINPKHISWVNPLQATDKDGNLTTFDPTTDMKGIELQFDNGTPVEVDTGCVTTFDMSTLDAYKALPRGTHKVDIAILTEEGAVGGFSPSVTFLIGVLPLAPTAVVLS